MSKVLGLSSYFVYITHIRYDGGGLFQKTSQSVKYMSIQLQQQIPPIRHHGALLLRHSTMHLGQEAETNY